MNNRSIVNVSTSDDESRALTQENQELSNRLMHADQQISSLLSRISALEEQNQELQTQNQDLRQKNFLLSSVNLAHTTTTEPTESERPTHNPFQFIAQLATIKTEPNDQEERSSHSNKRPAPVSSHVEKENKRREAKRPRESALAEKF